MIRDSYNREHTYLRISLTDRCNLRCTYCMPDEYQCYAPASSLMQADEISAIAKQFVEMGVTKIRLTGGEPLVRKDAGDIIRVLSSLPVELAMTTNGTLLHKHLDAIKAAKINSLNVSLDSLNAATYQFITKRNMFDRVMDNIQQLLEEGIEVKINTVLTKGVNDGEVLDFVEWTKDAAVHIRFIEFMPFAGNSWDNDLVFGWHEIMSVAQSKYKCMPLLTSKHATAKSYKVDGFKGTFSVISTMSAPFCSGCNRIRLSADGKMKNCLFSAEEYDLLSAYRNGENLEPLISNGMLAKAKERGGQFEKDIALLDANTIKNKSMVAIGG